MFSRKAQNYARYRWDYHPKAIETIFALTGLSSGSTVADLGAGTGIFTRHLASRVQKVYAIEPNPEQRQFLTADLAAFPSVTVLGSTAEATTLPGSSVDAITIAQALHWFEPQPARQEMLRILKNDGWLVLIWNNTTLTEASEAIESLKTEAYGADLSIRTGRPVRQPDEFYFGHSDFQKFVFPASFRQGWEEFWGNLLSISFMPDEDHPLFPALEAQARKVFARYSVDGAWQVDFETEVILGQPSRTPSPEDS